MSIRVDFRWLRRALALTGAAAALGASGGPHIGLAIAQSAQQTYGAHKRGASVMVNPGPVQAPGAAGMINPGPVNKGGRIHGGASVPQGEASSGQGGLIGLIKPGAQAPAPQKTK
jgi:hypothetical protein